MMTPSNLSTHLHTIAYTAPDGTARTAAIDLHGRDPIPGRAGWIIGRIFVRARAEDVRYEGTTRCPVGQELPATPEEYAYTHGGEEYRAACTAAWAAIDAVDGPVVAVATYDAAITAHGVARVGVPEMPSY